MNVGDVVKTVFSGFTLNEPFNLVQFYKLIDNTDNVNEQNIAQRLFNVWDTYISPIINTSTYLNNVRIDNVTDAIGVGNWIADSTGTGGGNPMPAFVAYGLKQLVGSKLTRAGYKFLPGVTEEVCSGDELSAGTPATIAAGAIHLLGAPVPLNTAGVSGNSILQPVVVGRSEIIAGSKIYELDLNRVQDITGITCFNSVRSRTSRRQKT